MCVLIKGAVLVLSSHVSFPENNSPMANATSRFERKICFSFSAVFTVYLSINVYDKTGPYLQQRSLGSSNWVTPICTLFDNQTCTSPELSIVKNAM